jgi:catechol 2,3-dioxygenase-like lactoylglutathione lyase family enzyme
VKVLVAAVLAVVMAPAAGCSGSTDARSHRPPVLDATQAVSRQGAFFAISVADVATMSRWYQDKLGLRVLSSGEAPNQIAKFAILDGNGLLIELIQHTKASDRGAVAPSATDAYMIHGFFKAGMVVDHLDAIYAALKRQGVPIAHDLMPAKDVPMRSFAVRDPEGNLLQFFGV